MRMFLNANKAIIDGQPVYVAVLLYLLVFYEHPSNEKADLFFDRIFR
jgi:hypothetical protein